MTMELRALNRVKLLIKIKMLLNYFNALQITLNYIEYCKIIFQNRLKNLENREEFSSANTLAYSHSPWLQKWFVNQLETHVR